MKEHLQVLPGGGNLLHPPYRDVYQFIEELALLRRERRPRLMVMDRELLDGLAVVSLRHATSLLHCVLEVPAEVSVEAGHLRLPRWSVLASASGWRSEDSGAPLV